MPKKGKKTQTQSVKMLRQNLHKMFTEGHSLREICEKYSVDISYTYKMLEDIAKENGVEREFYLIHPQKKSQDNPRHSYEFNNTVNHYNEDDFKDISNTFTVIEKDIADLLGKLENMKVNTNNYDCEEN